jgi:hypothetical protein
MAALESVAFSERVRIPLGTLCHKDFLVRTLYISTWPELNYGAWVIRFDILTLYGIFRCTSDAEPSATISFIYFPYSHRIFLSFCALAQCSSRDRLCSFFKLLFFLPSRHCSGLVVRLRLFVNVDNVFLWNIGPHHCATRKAE